MESAYKEDLAYIYDVGFKVQGRALLQAIGRLGCPDLTAACHITNPIISVTQPAKGVRVIEGQESVSNLSPFQDFEC